MYRGQFLKNYYLPFCKKISIILANLCDGRFLFTGNLILFDQSSFFRGVVFSPTGNSSSSKSNTKINTSNTDAITTIMIL